MNVEKYLKQLYSCDIKPIKTDLGYSNAIYQFEFKGTKYALRIPENEGSVEHRKIERKVQLLAKHMDFEEVYYDEINNIRITKWVDNLKTFSEYHDTDKFEKTINRIKEFHNLDIKTELCFDINKKYKYFLSRINKPLFDYKKYGDIINEYNNLKCKMVFSHNDLVDGNICFKEDKCYLIDYEYASMNYEYFDLMSLLSENNIYDKNRDEIFKLYFGDRLNDEVKHSCLVIEIAQDLLWSAWANSEYDNKNDNDYLKIFQEKISRINYLYK